MAASLILAEFTYRSGTADEAYTFTVVYDSQGNISVRDIENPYGLIMDPWSRLPQSVTDDICAATAQVENIMAATSAVNGTITFSASAEESVTFPTPFTSTSYRVQVTTDSFVGLRVINKTLTGFTIQATSAFTGTVGYDVFV